jgi:hypothetical protein
MKNEDNKIPKEIIELVNLHYQLVKNFNSSRKPKLDSFEVHTECALMLTQIIRHINAVCLLGKNDLSFFPSALIISRSAFELSAKVVWLLLSEDPWEQEARWLRYAQQNKNSEFNFSLKYLEFLNKSQAEHTKLLSEYQKINDFYKSVSVLFEKKFPGKYDYKTPVPDMKKMLGEIGIKNHYFLYVNSSQYAHGSMVSTQIYRKRYGTAMELGDFITPSDWAYCFQLTSMSLLNAGKIFLLSTNGNPITFNFDEMIGKFELSLKNLSRLK